ncbi:uncharacterized protein LOC111362688 [Spodoptera litura]|uniref:Uncharacterized protein LOC111362688 n=1 Tax=Spodoptera litura TaxID=69820 RepID=A0A9J7EUS2_SPOLT|nr:uncharacterized protein LOC111362688 [Spodoptera litura]
MSDGHGEPNQLNSSRKESVVAANVPSDSPVTDPGQVRGGNTEAGAAASKYEGQRGKSGALKKSARYRSRSLSASSADSYSSTSYTVVPSTTAILEAQSSGDAGQSTHTKRRLNRVNRASDDLVGYRGFDLKEE